MYDHLFIDLVPEQTSKMAERTVTSGWSDACWHRWDKTVLLVVFSWHRL